MDRVFSWRTWPVVLLCAVMGCGGGTSDNWSKKRAPTYTVNGKVLYKGEPVADAMVSFQCFEKNTGAAGKTDASGNFQLTTFDPGDGAVAGEHMVSVIKAVIEGGDDSYADEKSPNYGKTPPPTKTKYLVPEKYSKFGTSGLTVKVNESATPITLELKD